MDLLSELSRTVVRLAPRGTSDERLPRLRWSMSRKRTEPASIIEEAWLAVFLQGRKRTTLGSRTLEYGEGDLAVVSMRTPVVMQVTKEPLLVVGLRIDPKIVASLLLEGSQPPMKESSFAIATSKASDALLDAFRRYLALVDAPGDIPVLAEAIEREIIWRVLQSPQGAALRDMGLANSNLQRISHAIDLLEERYAEPLRIAELAKAAHMSQATFHRHFRKSTAMSPLQFQKRIRLQEARARLLAEPSDVTTVSYEVGYQSPSQFSREYRREFGVAPSSERATSSRGR